MPRYYFNVHDGRPHVDADGIDLPDQDAARAACLRMAGQIIAGAGDGGRSDLAWRFELTDKAGRVRIRMVFTVAEMHPV